MGGRPRGMSSGFNVAPPLYCEAIVIVVETAAEAAEAR